MQNQLLLAGGAATEEIIFLENGGTEQATSRDDGVSYDSGTALSRGSSECNVNHNGRYVVVSGSVDDTDGQYSDDGVTWSAMTHIQKVSGQFSAMATNGVDIAAVSRGSGGTASTVAQSSTDGVSWTSRTIGSNAWRGVAWNGAAGLFVAVGNTGSNTTVAASSPDGATWTARTMNQSARWQTITSNDVIFVAGAITGEISTSTDGITWTTRTNPVAAYGIKNHGATWSPDLGLFIMITLNNTRYITSPDGITWTARLFPTDGPWQYVIWNGKVFVVSRMTSDTMESMYSEDGINWTDGTTQNFPFYKPMTSYLPFGTY